MFGFAASAKAPVAKSQRRKVFRRLGGFEPLEQREVLSASGFSHGVPPVAFDVAIRGTAIEYSPLGLPSAMDGDLYTASGASRIGHYHESLQPILMDINGDQIPDFVGTTGVATFDFFAGGGNHIFASITTADTSYITGFTAAGQMVVGSQGTITAGTSVLSHVAGGFVSQSTVGLLPAFQMQTAVHFTITTPIQAAFLGMAMAGHSDASVSASQGNDGSSQRCDAPHQAANDAHLAHYEQSVDRHLGSDIDWSAEELA